MDTAFLPAPPRQPDRLIVADFLCAAAAFDLDACLQWLLDRAEAQR